MNAQDSTRSQLAGELGRVKSEITRLETEKQGLERQQRLDRQRLETIDQAVLQLADTDPQVIAELEAECLVLTERLAEQTAEHERLKASHERSQARVTEQEVSVREHQGVLQSADAELQKARRIIEAESRIDDRETSAWVSRQSHILGRVLEYIELPGEDRSAFEAAYPEVLSAFVCQDLETLDVDALPAGSSGGLARLRQRTPSNREKDIESSSRLTETVTPIRASDLVGVGSSVWPLGRPVFSRFTRAFPILSMRK